MQIPSYTDCNTAASEEKSSKFVLALYWITFIVTAFCVCIYVLLCFRTQRYINYAFSSSNSIDHNYSDGDTSSLYSEDCKEISSHEFFARIKFFMNCTKRARKSELVRCTTCKFTTMHPRCIRDIADEDTLDFTDPCWVCARCVQRLAYFYRLLPKKKI